ncbi:MAG: hypothetical protein U9Q81_15930 [Pseudomonadota bacterium]|nr:hypothetical protein [Pseudomonadota bacterium]
MTRGIHLKRLRTSDLELLGLSDDLLPDGRAPEKPEEQNLLAEADPVLSRVVDEVRQGLEGTLQLLEDALPADRTHNADLTVEATGDRQERLNKDGQPAPRRSATRN